VSSFARSATPGTGTIDVLCDTSVVLEWFHSEGEAGVDDARAVLTAYRDGTIGVILLDLTLYELGNALLRGRGWPASRVADQLDDVDRIAPVVGATPSERRVAADLAERHGLTFYDALFAATARGRQAALVTADGELLRAGLGMTAASVAADLGRGDRP